MIANSIDLKALQGLIRYMCRILFAGVTAMRVGLWSVSPEDIEIYETRIVSIFQPGFTKKNYVGFVLAKK